MKFIRKKIKSKENIFWIGFILLFPYTIIIQSVYFNLTFREAWIAINFNWKFYLGLPLVYLLYFLGIIKLNTKNTLIHFFASLVILMIFPLLPIIPELLVNGLPMIFFHLIFNATEILITLFIIIQLVFILKSRKSLNSPADNKS
jgi:hypothetical protein